LVTTLCMFYTFTATNT